MNMIIIKMNFIGKSFIFFFGKNLLKIFMRLFYLDIAAYFLVSANIIQDFVLLFLVYFDALLLYAFILENTFGKHFRPCLVDALVMAFYFDLLLSRHLCRAFLLGKAFVFVLKYKNDLAGR